MLLSDPNPEGDNVQQPSQYSWNPWLAASWGSPWNAAQQQQQLLELQHRQETIFKLQYVFGFIAQKFHANHVCVLQAWLNAAQLPSGTTSRLANVADLPLYAEPNLLLIGEAAFQDFRYKSCQGTQEARTGMPSKVWRSGAVQVVQNIKIIPPCVHPCNKLTDQHMKYLAEAVYIPVFDVQKPHQGPVAVLEALLSNRSTDPMLVANFISHVGQALGSLQLSLSHPIPTPIKRSPLAGRRLRPEQSAEQLAQDNKKQASNTSVCTTGPDITATSALQEDAAACTRANEVASVPSTPFANHQPIVDVGSQHVGSSSEPAVKKLRRASSVARCPSVMLNLCDIVSTQPARARSDTTCMTSAGQTDAYGPAT